ncbi:hypothetical protein ABTY96_03360 [Streptomyces sp. NPDC096057]|uniref:hypothetical protein n=1 Tax=Streptomyces sp. NPDC096057 TaxID=3155543 RepID=UPI003319E92C
MEHVPLYLHTLGLRAKYAFLAYAKAEPVRLRAALTSVVIAAGVLVPALHDGPTAERVGGGLAVVLPILVGESTRSKVTPAK